MIETPSLSIISTRRDKIAKLAREAPELAFTTLAHHIDEVWLEAAYGRTRKDGAVGVDGVTPQAYEKELSSNLSSLLERFKTGRYRAPAKRRVYIPKDAKGRQTRPIDIPTLEDKVLQRAVLMVLEPIYEQDFLPCSYGFRPKRSAHKALESLWREVMGLGGGWIIDLDIQNFFGSVEWGHLRSFLDQRVRDGVIRRTIGKWLNAGVLEDGQTWHPERGTPQGGVISPLLSNIYLHEVLDQWFEHTVKPRLRGRACLIRYADDAVLGFSNEADAKRVMEALVKRFGRYGLTLHPTKTRLLDFRPPPRREKRPDREVHSFDLLGFTHYWGRSRKGTWVIKRKTAKSRLSRSLQRFAQWCRRNRHEPVARQRAAINRTLQGHYAYYGITGNARSLHRFHRQVERTWRKWLSRRSHRGRRTWEQFSRLLAHYSLLRPRVVHSIYR